MRSSDPRLAEACFLLLNNHIHFLLTIPCPNPAAFLFFFFFILCRENNNRWIITLLVLLLEGEAEEHVMEKEDGRKVKKSKLRGH